MDPFESFNNEIVGYSKGSLAVGLQIAKGYCQKLIGNFMDEFPEILEPSSQQRSYELRQPLRKWLLPQEFHDIIIQPEEQQYFGVCVLPHTGEKLTSIAYTKDGMKRSADAALFKDEGTVAVIEAFVRTAGGDVYAVAHQYTLDKTFPYVHIFTEAESSRMKRLVSIEELKEAMIVVEREEQNTFYIRFLRAAEHVRS